MAKKEEILPAYLDTDLVCTNICKCRHEFLLAKGQNRTFVIVQYSNTNSFLKVALNLEVSALVVLNSTICVSFVSFVPIVKKITLCANPKKTLQ